MLKRWAANIGAVLALLLVCGLALIVLAVAANLFQIFMVISVKVNNYAIRVWVQLFYVLGGLTWLGFFFFIEHLLFNASSRAGLLLPRTLYTCGLEILVIGILHFGIVAYGSAFFANLILPVAELLLGAGLIWFARRKPRAALNSSS